MCKNASSYAYSNFNSHSHQDVVKGSSSDDEHPTLHPSEDDIISSGDDPTEADKKPADSIEVDTSNNQTFYQSLKLLCPGRGHEIKKCFKSSCGKWLTLKMNGFAI